jgi:mRNA interferase RelE/StbE
MTWSVTLTPAAARQLRKVDPQVRRRLLAAIVLLASEPRPPAAVRLVGGAGEWRVPTGDYRIVYEIHDERLVVLVIRIAHRREVYRLP